MVATAEHSAWPGGCRLPGPVRQPVGPAREEPGAAPGARCAVAAGPEAASGDRAQVRGWRDRQVAGDAGGRGTGGPADRRCHSGVLPQADLRAVSTCHVPEDFPDISGSGAALSGGSGRPRALAGGPAGPPGMPPAGTGRAAPAAMSGSTRRGAAATSPAPRPPGAPPGPARVRMRRGARPAAGDSGSGRLAWPARRVGGTWGRGHRSSPQGANGAATSHSEVTALGLFSSSKMGQAPWPGAPTRKFWWGGSQAP